MLKKRSAALDKLFSEAVFYKNAFLMQLLFKKFQKLTVPDDDKSVDEVIDKIPLLRASVRLVSIVGLFYGFSDTPQKIKADIDVSKKLLSNDFSTLQIIIASGENDRAAEAVEVLEKSAMQLLEDICFLKIQLLEAKKKIEKK